MDEQQFKQGGREEFLTGALFFVSFPDPSIQTMVRFFNSSSFIKTHQALTCRGWKFRMTCMKKLIANGKWGPSYKMLVAINDPKKMQKGPFFQTLMAKKVFFPCFIY